MVTPETGHDHRNVIISQKCSTIFQISKSSSIICEYCSIFNLPSIHCHGNTSHASKPSQIDNVIKLCYLCKFQSDTLIDSRDIAVYSLAQCDIGLGWPFRATPTPL